MEISNASDKTFLVLSAEHGPLQLDPGGSLEVDNEDYAGDWRLKRQINRLVENDGVSVTGEPVGFPVAEAGSSSML